MRVVSVILLLAFTGCNCNYHLKRAQSRCGYTTKSDTVWVKDTVIVPEVHTDTIVKLGQDTLYITKDRLQIKLLRLPGDSIFVDGKCKTDTMYLEVPVTVTNTEYKSGTPWYMWPLIVLALAIGLFVRFKHR